MKIPDKQEIWQFAFNHPSDIDFKDFANFYKRCIAKPYSFSVIDDTFASNNPSLFGKNFLAGIWKLIMTIADKIRDEILPFIQR